MKLLPFKASSLVSIGVELEYQIIDPMTYDLISRAKDLVRNIKDTPFEKRITPEITQSMIEINSSIHHSPAELYKEFITIRKFLLEQAENLGIFISGGGTHPFQKWSSRKIFPTNRFKNKSWVYRYLSKQSTVFGQHVHVGCTNGEESLYLTHALARYVPQLLAISASSPFYQNVDTGFASSRSNFFNSFPTSGIIPYLKDWKEFSEYYYKMRKLGAIKNMKDIYWDTRPKPEFGTVEIRVCDTPLTIEKAVIIAAYVQTLSHYLLQNKQEVLTKDLYYLYNINRFQANRYGLEGDFIHPYTLQHISIADDILETIKMIEKSTIYLGNKKYIDQLKNSILNMENDATKLREIFKETESLPKVVREQCLIWKSDDAGE